MKQRIGIMQGRLSPRPARGLQAFPHASWKQEFSLAKRLGFDAIEWIFEAERAADNPLCSAAGRAQILDAVRASGVSVRSVCADYFMVERLAGEASPKLSANVATLIALIDQAREIGAERILLPLLETSAVDTPELEAQIVESLRAAAPHAARAQVTLGLEMELPGTRYAALIERVGMPAVRAYYDVGNSSAQGVDVAFDVQPLLPHLHAVHVKDRRTHGSSMPLGTGDTNFRGFFATLSRAGFQGDLVLQHYFDSDPEGQAAHALAFVRSELARAEEAAA